MKLTPRLRPLPVSFFKPSGLSTASLIRLQARRFRQHAAGFRHFAGPLSLPPPSNPFPATPPAAGLCTRAVKRGRGPFHH